MMYICMIFIKSFTPSNFQTFKIISESNLSKPLSQNGIDLDSGSTGLILTREFDLSQVKVQESKLVQKVGPNQELKLKSTFSFPQWNVT